MSFLTDQNLKNELKKIIGTNCEPTHELEKMLLDADQWLGMGISLFLFPVTLNGRIVLTASRP